MFKIFSLCLLLLLPPFAMADTPLNASATIITQEYNDSSESLHYDIDLNYPQIDATPLDAASGDFNENIRQMISQEVDSFKAMLPNANKQIVPGSGLQDSESTLKISYEVNIIWPRNQPIISVLLTIDKLMIDAIRPTITHRSLNYDWQNGEALTLNDVFREDGSFYKFATHYCAKALSDTTGLTPTEIKNSFIPLTTWNLGPDILTFTFDDFPIPLKTQTVVIPYLSLQQFMLTNTALIACWDGETNDCSKSSDPQSQALKKTSRRIVAKKNESQQI